MLAEEGKITNLTLIERIAAAPFDRIRHKLAVIVLILGAAAAFSAFALEVMVEDSNVVDVVFLPIMTALFATMGLILAHHPERLRQFENIAYALLAAYALSMLVFQLRHTLPQLHTFSETMFWYPILYLVAFLLHRRSTAAKIALGIWAVSLLLSLLFAPYAQLVAAHDYSALNSLLQLHVSGLVYILLLYAFSRIEESYAETRALAYLDYLTQLPNRRYGETMLLQLLQQSREHELPFSVVMMDLDGFKKVNDRFGHDVGDRVLKRTALLIQRFLPRGARVIRWGGEEFLVILPETDEAKAREVALEVRQGLKDSPHEGVGVVAASFGVAQLSKGISLDELILRADHAMYRAKEQGGNLVVTVSDMLKPSR